MKPQLTRKCIHRLSRTYTWLICTAKTEDEGEAVEGENERKFANTQTW